MIDPNSGIAHRYMYEAYFYQKDTNRANQARDNAVRLLKAPRTAIEYEARGNTFHFTDPQRAIADYNEAIRLDPEFAMAYNNRGSAYGANKDYDRAIENYNEAIRLDPDYVEAYINRGHAYSEQKDYERAIADFNEALHLDPKFAMGYTLRGSMHIIKGQFDRALADYNEALRLDPNAEAYGLRGFVYLARQDWRPAIADFSEAIRLDPKLRLAYEGRHTAYHKIGRDDLADADAKEIRRLGGTVTH
jgi:tetratricopeptide (TPR) repeat protein